MNVSTPNPFEFAHAQQTPPSTQQHQQPQKERIFDSVDQDVTQPNPVAVSNQPASPPDLLHDSEEDDEDSLSTPSLSLSPKQDFLSSSTKDLKNRSFSHGDIVRPFLALHNRRKSVPHRSPSIVGDVLQASLLDKSVVFQLNVQAEFSSKPANTTESKPTHHDESGSTANQSCPDCGDACDIKCTSKIICGQSLLSALRKRVAYARSLQQQDESAAAAKHPRMSRRKRIRTASIIEIPRSVHRRTSTSSDQSVASSNGQAEQSPMALNPPTPSSQSVDQQHQQSSYQYPNQEDGDYEQEDQHQTKRVKKSNSTPHRQSSTANGQSSGRPSRVKGPCQACQEASDGCMRKAFNWPFPASQVFNDKGKPFVYLCNKCGLRYNKSGGCVCRNCRWVFCKEEKRKALQHIDAMRRKRPDGEVDLSEDIENFVCSPKYWTCGKPWKVGWVLDNLDEDDESSSNVASSPAPSHTS
ncbi:hypothetical protein [Parasitella parasitica]|uniref:Uncharacterized protein n=1 Tax=Parasitella parasitica TaxID=35722 RepID=A0A0B7MW19_9FUNG|nr:hypothetical protein [Parasitella parasitica]